MGRGLAQRLNSGSSARGADSGNGDNGFNTKLQQIPGTPAEITAIQEAGAIRAAMNIFNPNKDEHEASECACRNHIAPMLLIDKSGYVHLLYRNPSPSYWKSENSYEYRVIRLGTNPHISSSWTLRYTLSDNGCREIPALFYMDAEQLNLDVEELVLEFIQKFGAKSGI